MGLRSSPRGPTSVAESYDPLRLARPGSAASLRSASTSTAPNMSSHPSSDDILGLRVRLGTAKLPDPPMVTMPGVEAWLRELTPGQLLADLELCHIAARYRPARDPRVGEARQAPRRGARLQLYRRCQFGCSALSSATASRSPAPLTWLARSACLRATTASAYRRASRSTVAGGTSPITSVVKQRRFLFRSACSRVPAHAVSVVAGVGTKARARPRRRTAVSASTRCACRPASSTHLRCQGHLRLVPRVVRPLDP